VETDHYVNNGSYIEGMAIDHTQTVRNWAVDLCIRFGCLVTSEWVD